MHFREILVKDVRLNVERTLGLARIIFLSILWGAIFFYKYSEYPMCRSIAGCVAGPIWGVFILLTIHSYSCPRPFESVSHSINKLWKCRYTHLTLITYNLMVVIQNSDIGRTRKLTTDR